MVDSNTKDIVIRAGQGTLSFLVTDGEGEQTFHPYAVKSGMSISANLRQAFKEMSYLAGGIGKAKLIVSSPVVLMPKEDFLASKELDVDDLYNSVLPGHKGEEKVVKEMPELEAMALFAVNRDLQLVVTDNCRDYNVQNVMIPVWGHLYKKYYQFGQQRVLFAYFHDKVVDVFCFEKNRIRFANVFDATHAHDALYYMLFVWKQLNLSVKEDALFIVGNIPHQDWLLTRLQSYLANVHVIDQNADLNRSQFAPIKTMPFDMKLTS